MAHEYGSIEETLEHPFAIHASSFYHIEQQPHLMLLHAITPPSSKLDTVARPFQDPMLPETVQLTKPGHEYRKREEAKKGDIPCPLELACGATVRPASLTVE